MFTRKETLINTLDFFINKLSIEFIYSRKATISNINSERYQNYLTKLINENRNELIELFLENKNALNNLEINEFIRNEITKVYSDSQTMALCSAKLMAFLSKLISKEIRLKLEEKISDLLNESDFTKSIAPLQNCFEISILN